MKDLIQVCDWYTQSFKKLFEFSYDNSTNKGKMYYVFCGRLEPNTPTDSGILQEIIQLCYRDEVLNLVKSLSALRFLRGVLLLMRDL